MFGRKKQAQRALPAVQTVPRAWRAEPRLFGSARLSKAERDLFTALRESVPIVDAAIGKLVRLIGSFRLECDDREAQPAADALLERVDLNGASQGLAQFICGYLDSLLTYGEAVGEMLPYPDQSGIGALYLAGLDDVEIRAVSSPLELTVCVDGDPAPNQALVFATLLNPRGGKARGRSLLEGLPFVSSILLKVLGSLKNNWERAGDVRYAVTYDPKDGSFNEESARQIADEWKKAMHSDSVCDFVAAGSVSVKVIGAESAMPDCEVPVRVILEQIVAKLGIPPFLLGLSWSSTERMSTQQADILTSELEYYRAVLDPVIRRIADTHLRLSGFGCGFRIVWNDINLQDAVELSQARLNNARAAQIEKEIGSEVTNG